jgi:hypothetical protein
VYKDSFGMTWKDLRDPTNGVVGVWIILAAEWVWFMGLAWYLEQVFASGTGNRKHPLFFLKGWTKKVGWATSEGMGPWWQHGGLLATPLPLPAHLYLTPHPPTHTPLPPPPTPVLTCDLPNFPLSH